MLEGLINNKFIDKKFAEIKSFHENSLLSCEYDKLKEEAIVEEFSDNNTTETEKKPTESKPTTVPTEEDINKKIELQNSINQLKKKKEKMEESKRVYEIDLDLYNKFKKIMETNKNFNIPEMFIDKYELMDGLNKENKLCWENFYELYTPKNVSTGYDKLFN
jgi:hypothetical protein